MAFRIPRTLTESVRGSRCLLFIGAGVSHESGVPLGDYLARELAARLSTRPADGCPLSLPEISLQYEIEHGRPDLVNLLRRALTRKSYKPGSSHALIEQLNFQEIYTTNYDTLLERQFGERGYVILSYQDLQDRDDRVAIVKLHGCIQRMPREIVITHADYIKSAADQHKQQLLHKLGFGMADHVLLFLGYGLRDWNLGVAMFQAWSFFGEGPHPPTYAVAPFREEDYNIEFWRRAGVEIIRATAKEFLLELRGSLTDEPKGVKIALIRDITGWTAEEIEARIAAVQRGWRLSEKYAIDQVLFEERSKAHLHGKGEAR